MTLHIAQTFTPAAWPTSGGTFTACAEFTFGPEPVEQDDCIILAPTTPLAADAPTLRLLDFKVMCDLLEDAPARNPSLALWLGTVTGQAFEPLRPAGEGSLGVAQHGVVTPANLRHLDIDFSRQLLAVKVHCRVRSPSFWRGHGRRLVALLTMEARPQVIEPRRPGRPRKLGELLNLGTIHS